MYIIQVLLWSYIANDSLLVHVKQVLSVFFCWEAIQLKSAVGALTICIKENNKSLGDFDLAVWRYRWTAWTILEISSRRVLRVMYGALQSCWTLLLFVQEQQQNRTNALQVAVGRWLQEKNNEERYAALATKGKMVGIQHDCILKSSVSETLNVAFVCNRNLCTSVCLTRLRRLITVSHWETAFLQ